MEQAELAVEMDPLNPLMVALSCVTLRLVGQYEAAVATCEKALRADPAQGVARRALGAALRDAGRYDEYLEARIDSVRSPGNADPTQVLERGYDEGGVERAMALLADALVAQSGIESVQPTGVARALADLGEAERALDWIETAVQERDPQMPYAASAVWPEEVQTHPRFRALRRQMGFPERR